MTPATATRFAVLSAALVEGRTFASVEAIAQLLGTTRSSACNTMNELRTLGFVENEHRRLETLCLTAKGRKAAGLTSASATSAVAPVAAPAPAPAPHLVTPEELRAILDAPELVLLVKRVLAQPWGPGFLDALTLAPVTVRAPAPAPRVARAPKAKPVEPEPEEEEPAPQKRHAPGRPKKGSRGEGPYRVLDGDEETLGEFRTKAEAIDWLESDDSADTVVAGNGKVIARKGTTEEETSDE